LNILIIGAGQLGSRHLQSLLKVPSKLKIYVVDQSHDSLSLAKSRAAEIANKANTEVVYHTGLDKITNTSFFLTIVATGAAPRLSILRDVLNRFESKNIILEKFLFQDLESYAVAKSLIESSSASVFVNCPLRTYPIFKTIKKEISLSNHPIHMHYSGGDWVGLACNSIHYIDLLAFLGDVKLQTVDCLNLDSEIIPSKRIGHIEFTGTVMYHYSDGAYLEFQSLRGSQASSTITIRFGEKCYEIDELTGNYNYYQGSSLIRKDRYDVPYQSDLTQNVFDQLLRDDTCDLPTYEESSGYHKRFLIEMLSAYNQITKSDSITLPIT